MKRGLCAIPERKHVRTQSHPLGKTAADAGRTRAWLFLPLGRGGPLGCVPALWATPCGPGARPVPLDFRCGPKGEGKRNTVSIRWKASYSQRPSVSFARPDRARGGPHRGAKDGNSVKLCSARGGGWVGKTDPPPPARSLPTDAPKAPGGHRGGPTLRPAAVSWSSRAARHVHTSLLWRHNSPRQRITFSSYSYFFQERRLRFRTFPWVPSPPEVGWGQRYADC
eukprot:gene15881-biopygen9751